MYGDTTDEERDKAWAALLDDELGAPEPVAAPAAAPATASAPAAAAPVYADPFDDFGMPPDRRVELEPPPQRGESQGVAPAVVGGILDVLINKGRGLPGIVAGVGAGDTPYENWKRRKEWAHEVNGGSDPRSLWLRQQQMQNSIAQREADRLLRERGLTQNDKRIKIAEGGQTLKETAQERELNPANEQTEATREWLYQHGEPRGSLDNFDDKALARIKTLIETNMTTRADSPLAKQDIQHDAATAGAVSHATKQDRMDIAAAAGRASATNAADLDATKRARAEEQRIAEEQRKALNYEITLESLEKRLEARAKQDPEARLPGSENAAVRGANAVKNFVQGEGAAYSEEDAALNSDLSALGGQAFMEAFHNAPNATPEQARAMAMFRGNGSVASALARTRQKRAEIAEKRKREGGVRVQPSAPAAPGAPSAQLAPTDDDDLGVSYE